LLIARPGFAGKSIIANAILSGKSGIGKAYAGCFENSRCLRLVSQHFAQIKEVYTYHIQYLCLINQQHFMFLVHITAFNLDLLDRRFEKRFKRSLLGSARHI